jgi:hypothetical protein
LGELFKNLNAKDSPEEDSGDLDLFECTDLAIYNDSEDRESVEVFAHRSCQKQLHFSLCHQTSGTSYHLTMCRSGNVEFSYGFKICDAIFPLSKFFTQCDTQRLYPVPTPFFITVLCPAFQTKQQHCTFCLWRKPLSSFASAISHSLLKISHSFVSCYLYRAVSAK